MTVMNIVLFWRLLQSDFLRKNKKSDYGPHIKDD